MTAISKRPLELSKITSSKLPINTVKRYVIDVHYGEITTWVRGKYISNKGIISKSIERGSAGYTDSELVDIIYKELNDEYSSL